MKTRYSNYPIGTRTQHRNGYIYVKVVDDDGHPKLMAEARRTWELKRGDLEAGDRIYHMDGNRENNDIRNLAKIHFNQTRFVFLKQSKILYMPTVKSSLVLPVPALKVKALA